jgi:diguanylate cyclase (GGDEF)-like protein
LIDVDSFKSVNDRFGHAIGDRVLQTFADTAKAAIGSSGLVGRWGGDEFAALLYDTSRERAVAVAERIQHGFQKAVHEIDGYPVQTAVSIGLVFSPAGPLDLPALLAQADRALYRAKEAGRSRIEVDVAEGVPDRDPVAAKPVATARRQTA